MYLGGLPKCTLVIESLSFNNFSGLHIPCPGIPSPGVLGFLQMIPLKIKIKKNLFLVTSEQLIGITPR